MPTNIAAARVANEKHAAVNCNLRLQNRTKCRITRCPFIERKIVILAGHFRKNLRFHLAEDTHAPAAVMTYAWVPHGPTARRTRPHPPAGFQMAEAARNLGRGEVAAVTPQQAAALGGGP